MTTAVTMPRMVAAFLVAGHLHHLYSAVQDLDVGGCCPQCCAPCWALRELLDVGQLDELMAAYVAHVGGGDAVWDAANDRVDRAFLDAAWSADLGCGDDHDRACSLPA